MLKINNDIDLKRLEEFGFLEYIRYYYYPTVDCVIELRVLKEDRTILISVNDEEYLIEDIDILYDLIKAGLVEKVLD